jgi:type II secretory pathway pseudopilin PulG
MLNRSEGFTYFALLFIVAVMGTLLALTGQLWQKTMQEEKEYQLLFIGNQFRRAISLYYERTPGLAKQYPKKLTDLVKDDRYPSVQRYLREIYKDPLTDNNEWGLVRMPDGGIMGVYSLANGVPQKTGNFSAQYAEFVNSQSYSDWKFIYRPNIAVLVVPTTKPPVPK